MLGTRHRDFYDLGGYLHPGLRILRRALRKTGRPSDQDEPLRVAEAVARMGLRYAVVTSVNRDDQPDGGSQILPVPFRNPPPRSRMQSRSTDSRFRGNWDALNTVLAVRPDVLNHNTETVPVFTASAQRRTL